MQNAKDITVKQLARECKTIGDIQNRLRDLFKDTLQEALEAELEDHLGYEKHSPTGKQFRK